MSAAQWVGVALALTGVLFVIAKSDPRNLLAVRFRVGDGWIVAAALSWTAYSMLLRLWPARLGTAERLVAITGGILVLAAAVLPGMLAYQAYSFMLHELGPAKTALVLYLGPVYAAFSAWLLLGEPPAWYHSAGAALILPSIWVASPARSITSLRAVTGASLSLSTM